MEESMMPTKDGGKQQCGAQEAPPEGKQMAKSLIWVVGDSTVSGFRDSYYIPRQGWGEQLGCYFHANVYNLARSGASSKDFTGMREYDLLMHGGTDIPALGSGDGENFLLIGFGHNDQKTEEARFTNPCGDYRTAGSFACSLYENYVKVALKRGVIPILVTPIARLTEENTPESYQGPSGHITEDERIGDAFYPGGDYAQAIRQMCEALQLPCVDLTEATIRMNVALGEQAQYLHAFNGAKWGPSGDQMIPTALDKTHTNLYGAKMHAWLIAQQAAKMELGRFVREGVARPSYETEFAASINRDNMPMSYQPPKAPSLYWPIYTDAQGRAWHGTAFGDIGSDTAHSDHFRVEIAENSLMLEVSNNAGKIAATTDGILFYYAVLPAGAIFTLRATAVIQQLYANNQVSFGLMARDELYIDACCCQTMGDYVAAGSLHQGAWNCFGRKDGALLSGPAAERVYGPGDTVDLEIRGTADGFTLQYGENPPVSAGFDYQLTAIDSRHIYVGFYVSRNAAVFFRDIRLVVEE